MLKEGPGVIDLNVPEFVTAPLKLVIDDLGDGIAIKIYQRMPKTDP
jgi:hypothetical protein